MTLRRSLVAGVGSIVAVLLVLILLSLQSDDGAHAQTSLVRPVFGSFHAGPIRIASPVLVRSADGTEASLVTGFVNDGRTVDQLTSVTVALPAPAAPVTSDFSPPDPPALHARLTGNLGLPVSDISDVDLVGGAGHPDVVFSDPGARLPVGAFAEVTLTFRNAGPITIPVLIAPPTGFLAPYAPLQASTSPARVRAGNLAVSRPDRPSHLTTGVLP